MSSSLASICPSPNLDSFISLKIHLLNVLQKKTTCNFILESGFQSTWPKTIGTWMVLGSRTHGRWPGGFARAWEGDSLKNGDKDTWGGGPWTGLCGLVKLAYTAEEALSNQVTQLAHVSQPLSSPTPCLYDGFRNRAARMAEVKAYARTQQHTHNGWFSSQYC